MSQKPVVVGLFAAALLTAVSGCVVVKSEKDPSEGVTPSRESRHSPGRTLDALHEAASKADGRRYFRLFTDDAVFLGTDASERWSIDEFREYAQARFDTGSGWTYTVTGRFVEFSDRGDVAWFDERLLNEKYGECRGSGVLERMPSGEWKIAQYNLTVPVPNDLLPNVAEQIRAYDAARSMPAAE